MKPSELIIILERLHLDRNKLEKASKYAKSRRYDHTSVDQAISRLEDRYNTIDNLCYQFQQMIDPNISDYTDTNALKDAINTMEHQQLTRIFDKFMTDHINKLDTSEAENWNMQALQCHKLSYNNSFFGHQLSIRLSNRINQVRESAGNQTESEKIVADLKEMHKRCKEEFLDTLNQEENPRMTSGS